ncbi:MAG: hypothetical protein H5U32_02850 [Pseudomonas balearica]|jgi:hypothetical protein|uniref:hypothetical protein n=1 Tax=Stutzerimonas balearica TaxID=74829 RepID=UPI0019AB958E|nr:hypothetical protein [Stutzerimonas balearica]MBC7198167.1 hypothetical protein [Stutzerimonas balearica]
MRNADPVDEAADVAVENLERDIERALMSAPAPLPPKGFCYYCDESLPGGLRFCDEFCRGDYDYLMTRRKVNGIKP